MNKELLNELVSKGVKCNINDIVFIAKDKDNQLVWLEVGNENAGLIHIINNHLQDFMKAHNTTEKELPSFLEKVICEGTIVSNKLSKAKNGYNKIYDYNGKYYTFIGIGNNGFIVTAFPISK